MRSSTTSGHELANFMRNITDHINAVAMESKDSFGTHGHRDLAEQALEIVLSLSASGKSMDSLSSMIVDDPSNKSIKQKIANTSYEIAKHAKDLLGLLE